MSQVCISFVKILFNVTRPHTAILGNIPGTAVYRDIAQYLEATPVPGILAIRIDSAVYFSNSAYIHDKILVHLENEKQTLAKSDGAKVRYLVIDLTRKIHTLFFLSLINSQCSEYLVCEVYNMAE